MLAPYATVLRVPGARAFVLAGFVARLPMAMVSLGAVLLVRAHTGSYALAGAVSATFAIASALGAPQSARLVDRFGQRRVLIPVLSLHVAGLVGLLLSASLDGPRPLMFATAFVAGIAYPAMGSMVRSRWTALLHDGPRLQTAYALESVLDDVIFVVGPVVATTLATTVTPSAGLLAALACVVAGGLWFVAQRATEPPVARDRGRVASAIRTPGLIVLAFVLIGIGAFFGTLEVATVAFAEQRGHEELAGPLLALHSVASAVAGIAFGARRWTTPLHRRLLTVVLLLWAATVPLALATSLGALAGGLALNGLTIAPTLIVSFALIEALVPRAALTEGFAWLSSSLGVGLSIGLALGGQVAQDAGGHRAYLVGAGAAAFAVAAALLGRRALAARPA